MAVAVHRQQHRHARAGVHSAVDQPFEGLAGLNEVDEQQRHDVHVELRDRGHQAGPALAGQHHRRRQQFGVKHTRRQHHPVRHHPHGQLPNQRYRLLDGWAGIGRTEELGRIPFEINGIHRDDGVCARCAGTLDGVDAHPAGTDDDDGVAGLGSDADGSGAPARRHAARHQRRRLEAGSNRRS